MGVNFNFSVLELGVGDNYDYKTHSLPLEGHTKATKIIATVVRHLTEPKLFTILEDNFVAMFESS